MREHCLVICINGLSLNTIGEIDDLLMDSWREGQINDSCVDGLYDIQLNDAWLEMREGIISINDGDNPPVVLFNDLFVSITIS